MNGDRERNPSPFTSRAVYFKSSSQQLGALTNQLQAQAVAARRGLRVKSLAVVIHTDFDRLVAHISQNFHCRGLAVAYGIPKQFLYRTENHHLQVWLQASFISRDRKTYI